MVETEHSSFIRKGRRRNMLKWQENGSEGQDEFQQWTVGPYTFTLVVRFHILINAQAGTRTIQL